MNQEWIIYYDDGSSFSSDDGGLMDAPRVGVEIVVQANAETGYDFLCTIGDYFVYDPDRGGWRTTYGDGRIPNGEDVHGPIGKCDDQHVPLRNTALIEG